MAGPLAGLKVLDFGGIGPGPHATMILADLGAEVIRIDRPARPGAPAPIPPLDVPCDPLGRGKRSVHLDVKSAEGRQTAEGLVASVDVLVEGFRPGVMERLGFGPDAALALNPRLIYARVTGWGQDGPLAPTAGHDINYLALTGALHAMGQDGAKPHPPLNLLADFAGGGFLTVIGVLAALHERAASGKGQVVDAAMVDGVSLLTAMQRGLRAQGAETAPPGANLLDCGFPFFDTYDCKDGGHIALGCIEEPFFRAFLGVAGLDAADFPDRWDRGSWPAQKERLRALFLTRTRDEWAALAEGTDACLTPVLSFEEAAAHPHNTARGSYLGPSDAAMPAPAPRFSRTPAARPGGAPDPGADTKAVLAENPSRI